MPAFTRPGGLLLVFQRDGEPREEQIAQDGVRAVTIAMRMLAVRDELQPGDRLTVQREPPAAG
jgi:hypothetical protein